MGLRGPGAKPVSVATTGIRKRQKRPPWEKPGLERWQRVEAFLESLPITKGMLRGESMSLLPSQRAFIREVYGRLDADGNRTIRVAIKSEPAGNGKTGFVAGLHCCHLFGPEAEPRGEVDAAAVDRTQSSKMFDEIVAIIEEAEEFDFRTRVNIKRHEKTIDVLDGPGKGSKFHAMSGDARKGHGLSPSFWAYDELAQVDDRALLDNLQVRMGKRQQSLGIIISTQARDDEHPLSQLIDDGLAGNDTSLYVQLTAAPEDADPFDWKTVESCNQALGVFLNPIDVRNDLERAKRLPAWLPKYQNERLNQRVDATAETRIVTRDVWDACRTSVVGLDELEGRACYAGLDLSGKNDLSALVLAFPDNEPEPSYDLHLFAWTPEGAMAARQPQEQALFREWIKRGFLTIVPGPVVRYGFIARQLAEIRQRFQLRAVAYDRWRIDDLKQELDAIGVQEGDLPLEAFGQGFQSMSPAIEWFAELAMTGRLHHDGNPVLTAAVANAITVSDPAGNLKVDKAKGNRRGSVRIDPAVAMIMALGMARRTQAERVPEYQMLFVG
jgi:phage terminase large subunit-like protein